MRPARRRASLLAALLLSLPILLGASPGWSQDPVRLTGAEITTLLLGNSIEGTWGSSHFRSYFSDDGTTLYQSQGQPPEQGHWRIVADQYCSIADEGDACFNLYRDGPDLVWEDPRSGQRFTSAVIPGKAVPW